MKYSAYISWTAGALCTLHVSVLAWVLKLIGTKVSRPEFESRIGLVERQINSINLQLVKIAEQNGKLLAGILATKEASEKGERNIKELIQQLKNVPDNGRRGD